MNFIRLIFISVLFSFYKCYPIFFYIHHEDDHLIIKTNFISDNAYKTDLYVPNQFWGVDVKTLIYDLQVLTKGTTLSYNEENDAYTVLHSPKQKITLQYKIKNDPFHQTGLYTPCINKNGCYFIGHYVFIHPVSDKNKPIKLYWYSKQKHTKLFTSFGKNFQKNPYQSIESNFVDLKNAAYIFGDVHYLKNRVLGQSVYTVFWNCDKKLRDYYNRLFTKVLKYQRRFFSDFTYPYTLGFFISPQQLKKEIKNIQDSDAMQGLNLNKSFMFYFPKHSNLTEQLNIITHEICHTWLGYKIIYNDGEEIGQKWFFEGFTEYLSRHFNMDLNMIKKSDYIKELKHIKNKLMSSPFSSKSDQELMGLYFKNNEAPYFFYIKGWLKAEELNQKLHKISPKLTVKNFIKNMVKSCTQNHCQFSDDFFDQSLSQYIAQEMTLTENGLQ